MARRNSKDFGITHSEVETVTKVITFDHVNPTPVSVIRWQDYKGRKQVLYLYSDDYPNMPSERLASLADVTPNIITAINNRIDPSVYWYNHFPHLAALIESASAALQVFADILNPLYRNIADRGKECAVFYEWLSSTDDLQIPNAIGDITLDLLLQYRKYLYRDFRRDNLEKGQTNCVQWVFGIPGLLSFFCQRPSFGFVHESIMKGLFPPFSKQNAVSKTSAPYSEIEMVQILLSSDEICANYINNWRVMREIEQLRVGDWSRLEDICWVIANIEWQKSNKSSHDRKQAQHYKHIRKRFGWTHNEFHSRFSLDQIKLLASQGACPYETFYLTTYDSLASDSARRTYARAWVRRQLSFLFDIRASLLSSGSGPDWSSTINNIGTHLSFIRQPHCVNHFNTFWRAAELLPISINGISGFTSLFVPTGESLYPFHLFISAVAGENKCVVDTIERKHIYTDIDPNNIVYRGRKERTGNAPHRNVEITVARDEAGGIYERLEFIKEITEPLVRWSSASDCNLWTALYIESGKILTFCGRSNAGPWSRIGRNFCKRASLKSIIYSNNGEIADIAPLISIDAKRLRNTYVFKDLAADIDYHVIQTALQDKSFDVVVKFYFSSKVQQKLNFQAIAVIQDVLIRQMKEYTRSPNFEGEIIYDMNLSDAKDLAMADMNACTDPFHSPLEGQVQDGQCTANFDVCLGCRNSRVFKEHLPIICFRSLQYVDRKSTMPEADWQNSYEKYHLRAIDCLNTYARRGGDYLLHINEAWLLARTQNAVFLPPLG